LLHLPVAFALGVLNSRAHNKKARERVSPGLLGAALVNTLFWKILVTRVNGKK